MERIFIEKTIDMALHNIKSQNGGPFAAMVVRNGKIIGTGVNQVTRSNDPTAHAEVQAIRDACKNINDFKLSDCEIYTSCEPCPMCMSAIYWSRIERVYFALTKDDAADAGFDDSFLYEELKKSMEERQMEMNPIGREEALVIFDTWKNMGAKISY